MRRATLDKYLSEVDKHALFTEDQEQVMFQNLRELEVLLWQVLITHPRVIRETFSAHEMEFPAELTEVSGLTDDIALTLVQNLLSLDTDREIQEEVYQALVKTLKDPFLSIAQRAHAMAVELRSQFIASNQRMVIYFAKRFSRSTDISLLELVQEGNFGLLKAIHRFDVTKGKRFMTYARWWVQLSVKRACTYDRGIAIPVSKEWYFRYHKVRKELSARLGREPTVGELVEASGLSEDVILRSQEYSASSVVSLNRPSYSEDDEYVLDIPSDIPSADTLLADGIEVAKLRAMIETLPELERVIITRRFGLSGDEEETMARLGEELNVSRSTIDRIQKTVLKKLHQQLTRGPKQAVKRKAARA